MNRFILVLSLLLSCLWAEEESGKSAGLTFSLFSPYVDGSLRTVSQAISPLSFSTDLGLGKYLSLEMGLALHSYTDFKVGGSEISSNAPAHPFNAGTVYASPQIAGIGRLAPQITFETKIVHFIFRGGVFGVASLYQNFDTGSFDRALAEQLGVSLVNSDLTVDRRAFGWGWVYGSELKFPIKTFALSLGVNYYNGGIPLGLEGTYDYFDGSTLYEDVDLPEEWSAAEMLFRGFEFYIGASAKL